MKKEPVFNEECEICGKKVKKTASTSFVGHYCLKCHRLNRYESLQAIKEIQCKKGDEK